MNVPSKSLIAIGVISTLILAGCATVFVIANEESEAATPTVIDLAPGMRYTYTPTWPADLNVTITIKSQSAGDWGTISSGKTLIVNVPASTSVTTYSVVLQGTSTNPTQTTEIPIQFNIVSNLSVLGNQSNVVVDDPISFTPVANGMGTITWTVTTGKTLPTGLTLANGKVTGSIATPGSYTIELTATSSYGETANLTVTFQVVSKLIPLNDPTNGVIIYAD